MKEGGVGGGDDDNNINFLLSHHRLLNKCRYLEACYATTRGGNKGAHFPSIGSDV